MYIGFLKSKIEVAADSWWFSWLLQQKQLN